MTVKLYSQPYKREVNPELCIVFLLLRQTGNVLEELSIKNTGLMEPLTSISNLITYLGSSSGSLGTSSPEIRENLCMTYKQHITGISSVYD